MVGEHRVRAPLFWLLLPMTAGIAVGGLIPVPFTWTYALFAGLFAVLSGVMILSGSDIKTAIWRAFFPAAAFFFGTALFSARDAHPIRWVSLPEREIDTSIRVTRVFQTTNGRSPSSGIAVIADAPDHLADLEGQRVHFNLSYRHAPIELRRGQYLRGQGLIANLPPKPKRGFDTYLVNSGVHFRIHRMQVWAIEAEPGWFRSLTGRYAEKLESSLREGTESTESLPGLYVAMILGKKTELSPEQKDLFLKSGTMHLFAISGLHIGVIAVTLYSLLGVLRIPPKIGAAIGLSVLFVFVDATGATPSAVRAFTMAAFFWAARVLNRPGNPVSALGASALVILLLDPHQLFSPSFQLSYAVVLSLLLLGLPLGRYFRSFWRPYDYLPTDDQTWWTRRVTLVGGAALSGLAISLAATLMSTPISIGSFGLWSPGAVLANVVLVPAAGIVIMAGCGSMLVGLVGASILSSLFNHAALVVLWAMQAFIEINLRVPGMFWEATPRLDWFGPVMLILLIAIVLVAYSIGWQRVPGRFFAPFIALSVFLIFGVTFRAGSREFASMKSAYELAMERLEASDSEPSKPLSTEQKNKLAEVDTIYKGKIAEREIFLNGTLAEAQAAQKWEEVELIQKQIQSERARLEEEREEQKEKIRKADA
jgi:competence protein ComEC